MVELEHPFEIDTPLGRGFAIMVESDIFDNYWTVVMVDNRAIVTFRQSQIRCARNYSLGIDFPDEVMKDIIK